MTKELAKLDFNDKSFLKTIRDTVASGATNEEFQMFVETCKSTGLNPIKKEVWFIKAGGRVQIMTGVNGYRAFANSHPEYDGSEEQLLTNDKGAVIGAICKVYRKDRRFPAVATALISEFGKASPIWKQMPSIMIAKCAESLAIRKAFPTELNGTYTVEEMPQTYDMPLQLEESQQPTPTRETVLVDVQPEPEVITLYRIPEQTDKTVMFLKKRGCVFNEDLNAWECPRNLGEKLEQYKVGEL